MDPRIRVGDDILRICLAQELTQALGLPNDIDDPDGTVFSSRSTRETLSESDRNTVRILYNPRLEAGMTRAEAMPIVRRIAAELEGQQAQSQCHSRQSNGTRYPARPERPPSGRPACSSWRCSRCSHSARSALC